MKAVFLGDIPLGGGTSGSSLKAVTDFLLFTAAGGIFEKPGFRGLMRQTARARVSGLKRSVSVGKVPISRGSTPSPSPSPCTSRTTRTASISGS